MRIITILSLFYGLISAAEFYVATNGSDANSGTKEKPLATISWSEVSWEVGDAQSSEDESSTETVGAKAR